MYIFSGISNVHTNFPTLLQNIMNVNPHKRLSDITEQELRDNGINIKTQRDALLSKF